MIGVRTPYRISFVGGGTDMPVFYNEEPGIVISSTIAKYIYIFLHPYFDKEIFLLKYSETEFVKKSEEVRHPIIRQALKRFTTPGLDINSIADIPAGTGLGSSSSFAVALLHALSAQAGRLVGKDFLAEEACKIEIDELKSPIGKQDQYAAAFGGLNKITFQPDGTVNVEPLPLSAERTSSFKEHIMIFYTGQSRNANNVLKAQVDSVKSGEEKRVYLRAMRDLVDPFAEGLINGDMQICGELLHEGWQRKRGLTREISNPFIDEAYQRGRDNGAIGGKLLGAGGGGFLLFLVKPEDQGRMRAAMAPLEELEFNFDFHGSNLIYVDNSS